MQILTPERVLEAQRLREEVARLEDGLNLDQDFAALEEHAAHARKA